MARQASEWYQEWRKVVLASPWVSEIEGPGVRCRASAGYVPVHARGDLIKSAAYRCQKRARFKFKATTTRSMLTPDAVSGNYCPRHLKDQIESFEAERSRFEKWFAKYADKHG